jgi:hypothetical protein
LKHEDAFGLDTERKRLVRLFFQPVLVVWSLFAGGAIWQRSTGCWPAEVASDAVTVRHPTG